MRKSVVSGVVAGAIASGVIGGVAAPAHAQDAVQWRVEDGGNGHWYRFVYNITIGWGASAAAATKNGGHLACVSSPTESAFLFNYLNSVSAWVIDRGPFLGGYQELTSSDYAEPSDGWRWVTGEPWSSSSWNNYGAGEPNNDFNVEHALAMDNRGGVCVWNDVALNGFAGGNENGYRTSSGYLIEWSADCNSDGVVDFGQIRAGELDDANANNIPDCCEQGVACFCPDIDGNGNVDAIDLAIVIGYWGTNGGKEYPQADIDRSGDIDAADLAALLGAWGPCE